MNRNSFIFYDFETGSKKPKTTQPIQIAAVAIHSRKLEVIEDSKFESLIKPLDDEAAIAAGLDPIEDEALAVNGKTREELETAPQLKVVWEKFVNYVNSYNYRKDKWTAPIPCGYNNNNFDDVIIDRLCMQYGPYDKEWGRSKLFHPFNNIDVMKMVFSWTENDPSINSISMDSMREYMGMSKENAHDALVDVIQGANMLCRYLKLQRHYATKVKFKDAFKGSGI